MVHGDGVEPPTRRVSTFRSTAELPMQIRSGLREQPRQFRQVLIKRLSVSEIMAGHIAWAAFVCNMAAA